MRIDKNNNTRKPTVRDLIAKSGLSAFELSKAFNSTKSLKQAFSKVNNIVRNENRLIKSSVVKNNSTDISEKFVVCNGGLGDTLFGLAASYANDKCKLIHAANLGMQSVIDNFIKCFDIPYEVYPKPFTSEEFDVISNSKFCVSKSHLPLKLNYAHWENFEEFPRSLPVQSLFGKYKNPLSTKGMVAICPRGSNSPSSLDYKGKRFNKSREITKIEYTKLVKKFLRKNTIFIIGSMRDLEQYGMINHPHFYWITFDRMFYLDKEYVLDTRQVLSIINSCRIFSVDTWLKTYGGLADVPTTVIRTRFDGGYLDQLVDRSENIFLSKKFWNFNIVKIEDMI